eukprot:scaffold86656_cov48-Phaeocystis_antarctica.AAC.1
MIDASNASKAGVVQRLSEEEASAAWSNRVAAENTHGCSLGYIGLQPGMGDADVAAAWSRCRLGSAPARLLRLLRAAPGGSGQLGTPSRAAGPLGAQPRPRALERAASSAADFTA